MPSAELILEADRQLTICNACRYCEGFCAVFPAMELRRNFGKDDVVYLANLCFECRSCYYACPYIPPHEYGVNIPQVLSQVRQETYRDQAFPRVLAGALQGSKLLVTVVTLAIVALVFAGVIAYQGADVLTADTGGAFFAVVPYWAMVLPAGALTLFWFGSLVVGGVAFWRGVGGSGSSLFGLKEFWRASSDAFGLAYLKGGGYGCPYPDETPNQARRWYHHLVFYGVLFDTASTTVAAYYHNVRHLDSPYPYTSLPVVLGTIGGVMIVVGVMGLLWLKWGQDREPAHERMLTMDVSFLMLLWATALSGLVLMVLRSTEVMGVLLVLHLGIVAALFALLPYGKFAHVIYRYLALVKNAAESRLERQASGH